MSTETTTKPKIDDKPADLVSINDIIKKVGFPFTFMKMRETVSTSCMPIFSTNTYVRQMLNMEGNFYIIDKDGEYWNHNKNHDIKAHILLSGGGK